MNQPEFSELFDDWVQNRGAYPTGLNPYSYELLEFVEYCCLMYNRDHGPSVYREVQTTPKSRKDMPAYEGGQTPEPKYEIPE